MNSEFPRGGLAVHYLYDTARPDAIRVRVLFGDGIGRDQVHHYATHAEDIAIAAAKCHGWQDWVKIELDEQKVTDRALGEDTLLR